MTETTKTVFEKYEIRKTKKQKQAFCEYVGDVAARHGYSHFTERGSFGANNIVVGDPESAKVIYTAHYDTCARLPFPNLITPKNFLLYLLYQLGVIFLFFLLPLFAIGFIIGAAAALTDTHELLSDAIYALYMPLTIVFMLLITVGPANRHTANDNTSGTVLLLEILDALPKEQRDKVCLVFFDLEEAGLFGSASFAKTHKSVMKNTLLLNFDCVSDGDHLLFVAGKGAREDCALIAAAFEGSDEKTVEVLSKGAVYPSDQMNFKRGVGVSSLKRSKKFGLLYMDRIHTAKDVVFMEENIALLKAGALKLPQLLV